MASERPLHFLAGSSLIRVMDSGSPENITALLRAWSEGDAGALDKLVPLVENELHRLGHACLGHHRGDPLMDTTSLINELYVRLIHIDEVEWTGRAHFFALCAKIMRNFLVDQARARVAVKRGEGVAALSLDSGLAVAGAPDFDVLEVDEALEALARVDERKGKVVELRFFGGLTVEETAEVLRVSTNTVRRDWRLAKAWLLRELGGWKRDGTGSLAPH